MPITEADEIIRIINNPDVDPAKLARAVTAGDSKIFALTNRNDWNAGDLVFGELRNIGALYGAWTILVSYDSEEYLNKAKEVREALDNAISDFRKIPLGDDKTDPNFVVAESDYTTPKLNPDIPNFLSEY